MHRVLCLGSRWSSLNSALPRKTIPYRWAHLFAINNKKHLFDKFNGFLGRSPRGVNEVHEFFRQCVLGLKLEHPDSRVAIANTMWNGLKKKGTKMDASLHNSLLRVYISNNHNFSPSQFMDEMSTAGIVPNQGTLNLLLESHCRQGNLTGAQSILKQMYDNGHTITEQVYANLITGHTQSGDMDEAWKMLDVMEENGFEPGIPSYTALLQGHANHGEIEQVRETLKKMIAKKLYPSHDVYIAILDSLSMGGHHSFLNEVLDTIPNKAIVPDMLLLVQSWASRGEFESSLQLLERVSQLSSSGKALQVTPVVFHHMMKSNQPTSWLLETTLRMTAIGCIDKNTWENVLVYMHKNANAVVIMDTVRAMHQQGFAVKTHYLLPAFVQCTNGRDLADIKSCLTLLNELNLDLNYNVVHCIIRAAEPTESLVAIMKESRMLDSIEGKRKLISILCHQELFTLQDVLKKINVLEVGEEFLYQCLINHCQNEYPSISPLARMLKMLHTILPSTSLDNLTSCIQKCADTLSLEGQSDTVRNFAADLIDQGYPLSDEIYSYIMSAAARNTHPSSDELTEEAIKNAITNQRHDRVCKLYQSVREKGFRLSQRDCLAVISSLAHQGNIAAAEDLFSKLRVEGTKISRYTWNSLIGYYSDRGDIKNARKYYELLLSSGHKPNAFTLCVLMEAYSFHGDVITVKKLIEDERKQYGLDVSNRMLSCLVKVHLTSNNLAGAVAMYEHFPSPVALFLLLDVIVANKNDDFLERVKEITLVKSQDSSSYDFNQALMLSHIQNGSLDEAKEVALEEGFKMNHLSVEAFCRSRVSEGKVDAIRLVVQLYDELGLDTRSLQIQLLRAYIRLGDEEGVQSVQQKMTEFGMKCAAAHIITGEPVDECSSQYTHL